MALKKIIKIKADKVATRMRVKPRTTNRSTHNLAKFNSRKIVSKFKKRRPKKPNRIKLLNKLTALKRVKPPALPLNVNFYRSADGVYASYWLGKFINVLQAGGKKKVAAKHVYKALAQLKYQLKSSPLLVYLEMLDKIKPTFRLRNYIVRRVIIKEFPIAVLRPRRLILAVHWLKEDLRAGSGRFGTTLSDEIANKLLDFRSNPKKNNLVKKRNEFTQRTIKAQFNVRYNFK